MVKNSRRGVLVLLAALLFPTAVVACMWDYDTLKMERSRFPEALELITGKFLRHSPEFYEWRIQDRLKRLEADPANVALRDDLAVAYDKTGEHEKAIETALITEKLQPGRYETAANLGTFLFHSGKIKESLVPIEAALKINPEAHFGRERYQKWLTEYIIERQKGSELKLPMADVNPGDFATREDTESNSVKIENEFADYLQKKLGKQQLEGEDAAAAIKGVLGMMRFAKYDSPVLLEALGTVLTRGVRSHYEDAKLLAARSFLMASYQVSDESARLKYRAMAGRALNMQTARHQDQISLQQVEDEFRSELDEGRDWYANLHDRELSWIRDGKNPETEFDKLYHTAPEISGISWGKRFFNFQEMDTAELLMLAGGFTALLAVVSVAVYKVSRWRTNGRMASDSQRTHPGESQAP